MRIILTDEETKERVRDKMMELATGLVDDWESVAGDVVEEVALAAARGAAVWLRQRAVEDEVVADGTAKAALREAAQALEQEVNL